MIGHKEPIMIEYERENYDNREYKDRYIETRSCEFGVSTEPRGIPSISDRCQFHERNPLCSSLRLNDHDCIYPAFLNSLGSIFVKGWGKFFAYSAERQAAGCQIMARSSTEPGFSSPFPASTTRCSRA